LPVARLSIDRSGIGMNLARTLACQKERTPSGPRTGEICFRVVG
jgi:hypothetical protein